MAGAARVALFVTLVAAGCATASRAPTSGEPVVLEVDNQTSLDMAIYVLGSGGSRVRLGLAFALRTSWFTIPDHLIFGLTRLRFQADPIGGNPRPVTQEITVERGDTVVFWIPPR